ncbi:MAG: hypothetical protein LBN27_06790 [Prevotellaceae bacterium]|jgi:hypothetical protein|nr:hypothetical protein [Prevotellaceae bacterium]
MKKLNKISIFVIYILLLLAGGIVFSVSSLYSQSKKTIIAKAGEVKDIKYVLFTRSDYANFDFLKDSTLKRNVALLITDKNEIMIDQKLFLAEQHSLHLCGYSYEISFFYDIDSLYYSHSLNKKCEIFDYEPYKTQKQLDFYAKQLETSPTHYIYNLSIPVTIIPNEVKEKLKNSGLLIFFLDGKLNCYPNVYIKYKTHSFVEKSKQYSREAEEKDAEKFRKEIDEMINNVSKIATVIEKEDIYFSTIGTLNDSTYHWGSLNVTFDFGVDTLKVKNILEQAGAKVHFRIPKTYNIQLLDISPNIDDIKNKLKEYTFIEQISEYGK